MKYFIISDYLLSVAQSTIQFHHHSMISLPVSATYCADFLALDAIRHTPHRIQFHIFVPTLFAVDGIGGGVSFFFLELLVFVLDVF